MEDIGGDAARQAEAAMLEAFARHVREQGIQVAWDIILPMLAPVIGSLVRDAIPGSDPDSIAAACAIGRHRAFIGVSDLAALTAPTLVIAGADTGHPAALAARAARALPRGHLAGVCLSAGLETAADLALASAPAIRDFLTPHLPVRTAPGRTGAE